MADPLEAATHAMEQMRDSKSKPAAHTSSERRPMAEILLCPDNRHDDDKRHYWRWDRSRCELCGMELSKYVSALEAAAHTSDAALVEALREKVRTWAIRSYGYHGANVAVSRTICGLCQSVWWVDQDEKHLADCPASLTPGAPARAPENP